MSYVSNLPLVSTIKERCRVCYTCVRECPAKAIRIVGGQAEVLAERCIGCGNCVRVCSQKAKKVLGSIEIVRKLIQDHPKVIACIAPSFPAEFDDLPTRVFIGRVRALGFAEVHEVAFGADLVADRYGRLVKQEKNRRFIATSCPAVVGFVERYHPELVGNLAPIASPMIASARMLRALYGPEIKIVFIGPCIAKKAEAAKRSLSPEVDAVLTFQELRKMFADPGFDPNQGKPGEFNDPCGSIGSLFPITRGMLQAASLDEDLMRGDVVTADGRTNFVEAIKEFESGDLDAQLLEVLCCDGCIMGPGIEGDAPLFSRRSRVSRYVRQKMVAFDQKQWKKWMDRFSDLDLSARFESDDRRVPLPREQELERILFRMGKVNLQDELNCGACGYDTCREHAVAIYRGLAEIQMCLPYTIDRLGTTVKELAVSNQELARVQEALVHSEKLANMGQLAAGIAHEVNNPLGVVLMFAHLLLDQCDTESPLGKDLQTIVEHTDRCKKIVSGLLNFARQNRVSCQPTDLIDLVERCLKGVSPPESIQVRVDNQMSDPVVELDGDQINQVLVNLISNAVDAMPEGGQLTVGLSRQNGQVVLNVEDTGIGIPPENLRKIFEPFFTTKYMGKGTGLGLAVTYGIVKMHRGDIAVTSNADPALGPTGTRFVVTLPITEGEIG